MLHHKKYEENRTVVGLFCEIRPVKAGNKTWVVYYAGHYRGSYRTKKQALQFAEHIIQRRIKFAMEDLSS